MNTATLTLETTIHFDRRGRGAQKQMRLGAEAARPEPGRVPRVSRLMALAHRFDRLLREGVVNDYGELARLGHVTRARISQIMNLLHLAPDIQEAILFIAPVKQGRDPLVLRDLQPIASIADWKTQRKKWGDVLRTRMRTDQVT
jgi:hypothetical protein